MEEGTILQMTEEDKDAADSSSSSSFISDGQEASEDAQFIRLLDAMDHLLTCRESLSKSLSQGWMEITSARYSMGPSRIDQALFSLKPYTASTLVKVSAVDDNVGHQGHMEEDEQVHDPQQEFRFALQGPHDDRFSQSNIPADESAKSDVLSQSGLRQRHTSGLTKVQYADNIGDGDLSGSESDEDVRSRPKGYDPLTWFGTLVSPHLRVAQTSFREALETLVELATAQSNILAAYQKINESGGLGLGPRD